MRDTSYSTKLILSHDLLNAGMEWLLEKDENGKQAMHAQVCADGVCSENLGCRSYIDENLVPVLVHLLEQNPDGQARAAVIRKMMATVFQIGASVALLGEERLVKIPPMHHTIPDDVR